MSDLQWKIEDDDKGPWPVLKTWNAIESVWETVNASEAAIILLAGRAATQEKCAQWHEEKFKIAAERAKTAASEEDREAYADDAQFHMVSASAIRSLNLTEMGNE